MKEMFTNVMIMHHGIEILAIAYMLTGLIVFMIVIVYFMSQIAQNKEMEKTYKKYREEKENEKDE